MAIDIGTLFFKPFNALARGKVIKDISYGPKPLMKYDEYPVDNADAPVLVFWHGGSWKVGDKSMYMFVGHKFQKLGVHAFVAGYTKYPEQTFPGFIDDAKACLDHIKQRYPNRRVFVMGHSAGANTALVLGINAANEIDGVVDLSGPTNLKPEYWRPVFGTAIDDRSYDPRTLINKADKKTKFFIAHGKLDYIVPLRDSIDLADKLSSAGFKTRLLVLKFVDHIFILPTIMVGPRILTRRKIKKFIFED
jgi:acetyl esterase/lipase